MDESSLKHGREEMVDKQRECPNHTELVKTVWMMMVYGGNSAPPTKEELNTSWLAAMIESKRAEDIRALKTGALKLYNKDPAKAEYMIIACDIWCLFCDERYEQQRERFEKRVAQTSQACARDINKKMADPALEVVDSNKLHTAFYSMLKPKLLMPPMDDKQAFSYVEHLTNRLLSIWRVLSQQCAVHDVDMTKDLGAFTVPMLYMLSNGIVFDAHDGTMASSEMIRAERSLQHTLPPNDMACELTNVMQKRSTCASNSIQKTIIELCRKEPSVANMLNGNLNHVRL
jgi:hypothetical protein